MKTASTQSTVSKVQFQQDLETSIAFFNKESYSYSLTYESKLSGSNKVEDRLEGVFHKNGKKLYCTLPGNFTVQDDKFRLLINKESREILVVDPDFKFGKNEKWNNFDELLNEVESIDKFSENGQIRLVLKMKKGSSIQLQEIILNREELISEIRIHYSVDYLSASDSDLAGTGNPILTIKFNNIKEHSDWIGKMDVSSFVVYRNKEFYPIGDFINFKVIDYRLEK